MNMNSSLYVVYMSLRRHGIEHFLDKYGGIGADDMETNIFPLCSSSAVKI